MCFFSADDIMIWEGIIFKRKLELIFTYACILRLHIAKNILNVSFYCVVICDNVNAVCDMSFKISLFQKIKISFEVN